MPINPDNPRPTHKPEHPEESVHKPKLVEVKFNGADLLGTKGSVPRLVKVSAEDVARIPPSFIVKTVTHQSPRGPIEIPYTYPEVIRQLRKPTTRKGVESFEGEPISGVIPQNFIDAYKASKLKQGHRLPHMIFFGGWIQTMARNLQQRRLSPLEVEKTLSMFDLFVLATPTQDDIERDPLLIDKSAEMTLTHTHSRLALRDPIGYAMYIIKTEAESQGINIEVNDQQMTKRLARFQKEQLAKDSPKRRPLAEPRKPQKELL